MSAEVLDRNAVLDRWAEGEPATSLALSFGCSESTVYKIAKLARDAKDPRGEFPSDRTRELFVARQHMGNVAKRYVKGESVDRIADQLDLEPHVVRAAIYLAAQSGVDVGLVVDKSGGV